MKLSFKSIWIESEEKGTVIGGQPLIDDNSDVIVTLKDDSRYVATFFTYANIERLRSKNRQTGECLNGKYFWASDMILIEQIEREEITQVIEHLIKEEEFNQVFRRLQ